MQTNFNAAIATTIISIFINREEVCSPVISCRKNNKKKEEMARMRCWTRNYDFDNDTTTKEWYREKDGKNCVEMKRTRANKCGQSKICGDKKRKSGRRRRNWIAFNEGPIRWMHIFTTLKRNRTDKEKGKVKSDFVEHNFNLIFYWNRIFLCATNIQICFNSRKWKFNISFSFAQFFSIKINVICTQLKTTFVVHSEKQLFALVFFVHFFFFFALCIASNKTVWHAKQIVIHSHHLKINEMAKRKRNVNIGELLFGRNSNWNYFLFIRFFNNRFFNQKIRCRWLLWNYDSQKCLTCLRHTKRKKNAMHVATTEIRFEKEKKN